MLRKKQEVGGKIGHEEYTYYLGDPSIYTQDPRVRGQGDIHRRGPGQAGPGYVYHKGQQDLRPPWGIDADDAPRPRRQSGAPNNNNQYALVPEAGAPGRAAPDNKANAQHSPYGPPVVPYDAWPPPQPQPAVMAFGPVVGSNLSPVQPLSGVLPPIYRPKPPLSFQPAPLNPHYATPTSQQPLSYGPTGDGPYLQPLLSPRSGPHLTNQPEIEMTPMKPSPAGRPMSSPGGFLPPLNGDPETPAARGRRRGSGSHIPGLGGADAGGPDDERQAQSDARRRAQQLQEENARLMKEQQRRKEEERQRRVDEDLVEERRLQREREAVARRELAEVEREREEKEMKMMGPAAYAAKKRQEEAQKRAQTPPSPAPETTSEPASTPTAAEDKSRPESTAAPVAPFASSPPLFPAPQPLKTTSTTSYTTYLAQQPPPLPQALAPPQQRFTTYSYETDHLKAELRQIADEQRRLERLIAESLRANQATAAATLRVVSAANNNNSSGSVARNGLGAGTYLTETLPFTSNVQRARVSLTSVNTPPPAAAGTTAYSEGTSLQPPAPAAASSSWLDGYLKPNLAPAASAALGGANPPPARTTGLGWADPELTTSTRLLPQLNTGVTRSSEGISVVASQIHAATADWSTSRNRSIDPDDLSFEPSTFVGPVVPPQTSAPTRAAFATDTADAAPLRQPSVPAAEPSLPPTPAPLPQTESKATPNTSSILKKGAENSPHEALSPERRRSSVSSVRWDEL